MMELTQDNRDELREILGETIDVGSSDADTMFLDEDIDKWLTRASTMDQAAFYGWRAKAAELLTLVNTRTGQASRDMERLYDKAAKERDRYGLVTGLGGVGKGRIKVHDLGRR